MNASPLRRPASAEEPLVSVIIPVFQGERYILGAIRSVLNQTHRELEVWVVDDGSTDGTSRLLETVTDPRVRVLKQANSRTAAARNLGISHATGEYIAFLDHDDRWFPEKVATELAVLGRSPDPVGIAYSWYYAVDDNDRLLHAVPAAKFCGDIFDDVLANDNFLIPSVTLFHRKVFAVVGGFENIFHEDYSFALKACRRFPAYPTCRRLIAYRQSPQGKCLSIISDYELAYREQINVVDQLESILSAAERRQFLETQKRGLFFRFLMYGLNDNAKRLLPEVTLSTRLRPKNLLARLYVRTGINLFPLVRSSVRSATRLLGSAWWSRKIKGLEAGSSMKRPT
jgi:glycosyltransferase involved in cell wall biosynthesis